MAILTDDNQKKLEDLLVKEGLVADDVIQKYRTRSTQEGKPLLTLLVSDKVLSDEALTKEIASVSAVPYVNLTTAQIEQKVLDLLPLEIAERYMAVPLGEMQNRLAVAMLDANNVQAVDFLSNKIQRPLKVYMASEAGVRAVLDQYHTDLAGGDRKSTRLNSSHTDISRMPSSA